MDICTNSMYKRKIMNRAAATTTAPQAIHLQNIQPVVRTARYAEMTGKGGRSVRRSEPVLRYIARGQLSCRLTDRPPFVLSAGDLLLTLPDEECVVRRQRSRMRIVLGVIRCEPVRDATWQSGTYELRPRHRRLTRTGADTAIHELFRRADEVFTSHGLFRGAILSGIVREIWLRLGEYWRGGGESRMSPRMQEMVQFLLDHVEEPIGRGELAEHFHLTPQHINYLFKHELGISPTAFILRERVHRAHSLLREGALTVQEVANRVGFDDPFYFSKTFKRITGISPSSVR